MLGQARPGIVGIPLIISGVLAAILSPLGFLVICEWQCLHCTTNLKDRELFHEVSGSGSVK